MAYIFPVAIYKDIEFNVDDNFMSYLHKEVEQAIKMHSLYRDRHKDKPDVYTRNDYMVRLYTNILKMSVKDIENILNKYSEDICDEDIDGINISSYGAELFTIIQEYLGMVNDFSNCSYEFEPDFYNEEEV
jgi:hypothetical protein